MKKIVLIITALAAYFAASAQDGTVFFAEKDGGELFLDYYNPAPGSETSIDGKEKPTVIFLFGGGFKEGTRDDKGYAPWFKAMTDNGYRVFSIDYRLGLVGSTKAGVGQVKEIHHAISIAVEDLFSATAFILDNAEQFGVSADNIVISGSSAGAISVLEADWMLSNGENLGILPEGFRYAGVMSFAGAVLSDHGKIRYANAPAPTLFLHGTADKVVNYKKMWFFNWRFNGTDALTRTFEKNGYSYNTLRYLDHGHDIASSMFETLPEQFRFLETNVMKGIARKVDAVLDDPSVPVRAGSRNRKELYGGE